MQLNAAFGIKESFGTYYVYRSNGGASGKDFLERFFSLSLVIAIRQIVFWFVPFVIVGWLICIG